MATNRKLIVERLEIQPRHISPAQRWGLTETLFAVLVWLVITAVGICLSALILNPLLDLVFGKGG